MKFSTYFVIVKGRFLGIYAKLTDVPSNDNWEGKIFLSKPVHIKYRVENITRERPIN